MGAVRKYEKKQLASFYNIACVKHRVGTCLLVLYSIGFAGGVKVMN